MNDVERILLNTVQTNFPVTSHPYETLGRIASISEKEAWQKISYLRQKGIIRRLGGVFDSHRLGYHSTLCAAKVPQEKIPIMSEFLNGIPGVTHNYLREHQYNMWFTLIASTEAEVQKVLSKACELLGTDEVYSLPAIRIFKIRVDFKFKAPDLEKDLDEDKDFECRTNPEIDCQKQMGSTKYPGVWDSGRPAVTTVSNTEKELIRLLQVDLPTSLTPFKELAEKLQWTEEEVLEKTQSLLSRGLIRRFGAVLRHQMAGFTANAMGVWEVPEDIAPEIGTKMAAFREVSHCYQRPALPDWPYTLFTMIHGRSAEDCEEVMKQIAQNTGIQNYRMLFSKDELKKSSMRYFMEKID